MLDLCMIYPTRERPEQAAERLHAWLSRATPESVAVASGAAGRLTRIVVGLDDDDPTRRETLRLLAPIFELAPAMGVRVDVAGGTSLNKIHATNRCVPTRVLCSGHDADPNGDAPWTGDFDVLVVNSDDMAPLAHGWDAAIARDARAMMPDLDGALWYHDGHQDRVMTWPVVGRALYDRLGHVYHPIYETEWADNELHEIALRRGRLFRVGRGLVEHKHFVWGGGVAKDALYERNQAGSLRDRARFEGREKQSFGWDDGLEPMLSVIVPTVPERRGVLGRLMALLDDDLRRMDVATRRRVELVVEEDAPLRRGGPPIGARRADLLGRARGAYACFIDDDDFVGPGFMAAALAAILDDPSLDVLALDVRAFLNGSWFAYEHSVRHASGWREAPIGEAFEDRHGRPVRGVRFPNHLNVTRRELALRVPFAREGDVASHGEDRLYSDGMRAMGVLDAEGDAGLEYAYVPGRGAACDAVKKEPDDAG